MGEFFNCENCGKKVPFKDTMKVQASGKIVWLCKHCYYERGGE